MKSLLFSAVLLLSSFAFAADATAPGIAGESVHGACLVYHSGPPTPAPAGAPPPVTTTPPPMLADVVFDLKDQESKVIYQAGTLTYSLDYVIRGKGDARYELPTLVLTIEDTSRQMKISADVLAGTYWKQAVTLHAPFGLPEFGCNPL